MVVSGFISQGSSGFLFAGEEARKKRAFFPEDIVNSKYLFHSGLLQILYCEACFTKRVSS
jgi:hypothetical protein